ncbi:MAG: hypothetical protein ACKV2Q_23985 [Planctomycetaceae bacterium]
MSTNDPNAESREDSDKRPETNLGDSTHQQSNVDKVEPVSKSPPVRQVHTEPDLIFDEIVVRASTIGTSVKRRIHTEPDFIFDEIVESAAPKQAS